MLLPSLRHHIRHEFGQVEETDSPETEPLGTGSKMSEAAQVQGGDLGSACRFYVPQFVSHEPPGYLRELDAEASPKSTAGFTFRKRNEIIAEHPRQVSFGNAAQSDASQRSATRMICGRTGPGVCGNTS